MISSLVFKVDRFLRDKSTDTMLTLACLTLAAGLVYIAFCTPPEVKAGAIVWTVAP